MSKTALEKRMVEMWMDMVERVGGGLYGVDESKVARNLHEHMKKFWSVMEDLYKVQISEDDKHNKILTFIDSKGNKVSIWMAGETVRSITPY